LTDPTIDGELHSNQEMNNQILHEHLAKMTICTKSTPHRWAKAAHRICAASIQAYQTNPHIINCIITEDESQVFHHNPENITQHGVENKTITDARKCHCRRQGSEGKGSYF